MFGAALAACAGRDTPPISDDFARGLRDCASRSGVCAPPQRESSPSTDTATASSSTSGGRQQSAGDGGAGPPGGGSSSTADAGSNGSSGSGGTVCDGFPILQAKCGSGSACHGSGSTSSAFAASRTDAATFVDERAEGSACAGETSPIFDPDDAAGSLVITKLGASAPCGIRMPLGGSVSDDEIACVQEWIESL